MIEMINTTKAPLLGSYRADDCLFLLTKVEPEFYTIEDKERLIQTGAMHYSEMVNQESAPSPEYAELFVSLTAQYKQRLADEVLQLSKMIIDNRLNDVCIVSLVRAGTPIGVLLNRALKTYSNVNTSHYSVSIIRDKGIDENALDYLIKHEKIKPESIVFVDGWTAKGVITQELKAAIGQYNSSRNVNIPDQLFVISDIGGTADYSATFDDYVIPSALMNSTVSGLVSRSILNHQIGEDDFHGCISYSHLESHDHSNWFVDQVSACFTANSFDTPLPQAAIPAALRQKNTHDFLQKIMQQFNVSNYNRIKPGIAEATRVMLRRVPDLLIVQSKVDPSTVHLLKLASEKSIEIIEMPEMPFGACALIKDVK
ncbi:cysteine protease StiP family protein [Moritella marina ATCC 15381]|uniref:Cysteine protease StiP family protein n=2 Tax=Moritella marina TaxID=90736 RepID=A0A5J6WNW3_MORMI|nr:cysteine protease StiP family protein [Moritella marina]QFI38595.1 cysteine protease StiP family protein [Moritella marina ATCC 15381]